MTAQLTRPAADREPELVWNVGHGLAEWESRHGHAQPTPRHRRHERNLRGALVKVLVAGLAALTVLYTAAVLDSKPLGSVITGRFVADSMTRVVAHGLGSATLGGAYATATDSSAFVADVHDHAATLAGLRPGTEAEAWLGQVFVRDAETRMQFVVPRLPARGDGLAVGVVLRRLVGGDSYRAWVHATPGGVLELGFSRSRGGVQIPIGAPRHLTGHLVPGTPMVLDAKATGSRDVQLAVRVHHVDVTPGSWEHQAVDSSAQRISAAGATGMWVYSGTGSPATQGIRVQALDAYAIPQGAATVHPTRTVAAPSPSARAAAVGATRSTTTRSTAGVAKAAAAGAGKSSTVAAPPKSAATSAKPALAAAKAGAANPGTTSYPIAANAIYVAPGGSDSAGGSRSRPVHTLAKAIRLASSGAQIVLRKGTYHESVTVPSNKSLTIQAYPHEAVWFDGTTAVSGWRASGNAWVHSGWTAAFDHSPSFSYGGNSGMVNSHYPMAAYPDQVWVGGRELRQVGSAAGLQAGTFWVDKPGHRLYVGSNPSAGVRASDRAQALVVRSSATTLRGFGVRRYATPTPDLGTVVLGGRSDTIDNVSVVDNATTGIAFTAQSITAKRVTVSGNGLLGAVANYADGLSVTGMLSEGNNAEHFNTAPAAGGFKITRTRGVTVRNSTFNRNLASGLWVDESSYDIAIVNNRMTSNAKHGFTWEIGSVGLIAGNVVTNNAADGLKINDDTHVRIWNNTIRDNRLDVILVQDNRRASNLSWPGHDPRRSLPDPTVTWMLGDVTFYNNDLRLSGSPTQLWVGDGSRQRSAARMGIQVDNNAFEPMGGVVATWGVSAAKWTSYYAVGRFVAGAHVGHGNGDSSAVAPRGLPSDVAAKLGRPAGSKHLGAY